MRTDALSGKDFRTLVADEALLRASLEEADIVTSAMVLVQLTGEAGWLEEVRPCVRGPWDYSVEMPEALNSEIREALVAALRSRAANGSAEPAPPSGELLQEMMSVAVGEPVPADYVAMMAEEMAFEAGDPKGVEWRETPSRDRLAAFPVAVIGAGMSGLCAAVKLAQAGLPFTVFEKNDTVGGTWYENDYPGAGVDTPNHFYSYSFAPNHAWTHFFSKRDALQDYFEHISRDFGVRPEIRFRTVVEAATWDAAEGRWRLALVGPDGARREESFRAVICAVGQLNRPFTPAIPGLEDFAGPLFHTAHWDKSVDHRGRRVALIGTGASAMQVGPTIAPEVARLAIFQRSPHWAVHNPNYHRVVGPGKRWVLKHLPYYAEWYRFQLFWGFADGLHPALQIDPEWDHPERSLNQINERHRRAIVRFIERKVAGEADLLAKVVPPYPPYGKRILIDNHWYDMLTRDNVELVVDGIEGVTAEAILTTGGGRHEVDMIVLATGFHAREMVWPMEVRGRDGRRLRDIWGEDDPRAYLGIAMPGFPNFFVLYGPNTNLGHGGSVIFHTECQVRYAMKCLRELVEGEHGSMEVLESVHDDYNEAVDAAHRRMVWSHPGMGNWYKNAAGRVVTNSPWRLVDYWRMTAELDRTDFRFARARPRRRRR